MGENSCEIRQCGENDEAADEGGKGGLGTNVDTAEDGAEHCAEQDGVGRVSIAGRDLAEEAGEGSSVVAGKGPESAR